MNQAPPIALLVHGEFTDSASRSGVIERLHANGVECLALANPRRGVRGDATYLRDVIAAQDRPFEPSAALAE